MTEARKSCRIERIAIKRGRTRQHSLRMIADSHSHSLRSSTHLRRHQSPLDPSCNLNHSQHKPCTATPAHLHTPSLLVRTILYNRLDTMLVIVCLCTRFICKNSQQNLENPSKRPTDGIVSPVGCSCSSTVDVESARVTQKPVRPTPCFRSYWEESNLSSYNTTMTTTSLTPLMRSVARLQCIRRSQNTARRLAQPITSLSTTSHFSYSTTPTPATTPATQAHTPLPTTDPLVNATLHRPDPSAAASHLNSLFEGLRIPADLAMRMLTHKGAISPNALAVNSQHNSRLSFLGKPHKTLDVPHLTPQQAAASSGCTLQSSFTLTKRCSVTLHPELSSMTKRSRD